MRFLASTRAHVCILGVYDGRQRKKDTNLVEIRTLCLAYSTPQRWLPLTSQTFPHTKSTPTLPSVVSDPELGAKKIRHGLIVRNVARVERAVDGPSLRRENLWVHCSAVRRGMLTERESGGQRVALSVCIEQRIVRIVGWVASW